MAKIVTFGELMLRLSPPGNGMLLQNPLFEASFGGAEANVAVSLAHYGEQVAFVTALPDNPIGDAAIRTLRGYGVNVSDIQRRGERIGVCFIEKGAACRPSRVLYDRANSSFALMQPEDFDWNALLQDADWFHISGITPALSEGAALSGLEALRAAKKRGCVISCDLNYRKKLWRWGRSAQEVMPEFVRLADILMANEEDCQLALGMGRTSSLEKTSNDEHYRNIIVELMDIYSNLAYVTITLRESYSADENGWSALGGFRQIEGISGVSLKFPFKADVPPQAVCFFSSKKYHIADIVDRVGAGDAFSAGLIYGLRRWGFCAETMDFATAAGALKHTVSGDFSPMSVDSIKYASESDNNGRIER